MRFKTNAEELVGVEKLAVVQMDTSMLTKAYEPLPHLDTDSLLFVEQIQLQSVIKSFPF